MTDLPQRIHEFIQGPPGNNLSGNDRSIEAALSLLGEARRALSRPDSGASQRPNDAPLPPYLQEHLLTADRDAAWRVANAAAEGHAAIRARYHDLAVMLGAVETDSAADIAHRLAVSIDNQTKSYGDALRASERDLDEANSRLASRDADVELHRNELERTNIELAEAKQSLAGSRANVETLRAKAERWHRTCEMMGWDSDKPAPSSAAVAAAGSMAAIERQELEELRQLARANAEVLQRQGDALAQLQAVLALAGAPKDGDLRGWASDVRNTIEGQRREINGLVDKCRAKSAAREAEIAEFQAAAETLPEALQPTDRYNPYGLMGTPIQVFTALRERALAILTTHPPNTSRVVVRFDPERFGGLSGKAWLVDASGRELCKLAEEHLSPDAAAARAKRGTVGFSFEFPASMVNDPPQPPVSGA